MAGGRRQRDAAGCRRFRCDTLKHQDVLASSNACAEEAFMSARVVRAAGTEAIEQARYQTWLQ